MSSLGCHVFLMIAIISRIRQTQAACTLPTANFLRYGSAVGDTEILFKDVNWNPVTFPTVPYNMFGTTGPGTKLALTRDGYVQLEPFDADTHIPGGVFIVPREYRSTSAGQRVLRVGTVYMRHSNDSLDLLAAEAMACGPFDGVFIVTHVCLAEFPVWPQLSYQVVVAYGPGKTVALINYGNSTGLFDRFVKDGIVYLEHPLNQTILDDNGIIIMDVTDFPTAQSGEALPVLDEGSCPLPTKTCEVYADGSIKTMNGSTVLNSLTMKKNFVATVGEKDKKNNDACKFFLMIRTKIPTAYVRVGVGVHPANNRKFLRNFQFLLNNDSIVKEFGPGVDKVLDESDMPYSMDDVQSDEPLGITVAVTDANDGWIIKSTTCGYSFVYLWDNKDPIVTMTLEGDRYDGRILGTCSD